MLKNFYKISIIALLAIMITMSIFQVKVQANTVEYKGGADGLIATPDDFFLNLGELLPGDTKEDVAYITNSTNDEVEIFFKTEPLNEEEYYDEIDYSLLQKINLKITLKQTNAEEHTIYDGNLGAEVMNEYISLGTYSTGFDGEFIFKIEVPSDLQNDYTISTTKVKWVFAAEKIEKSTEEKKSVKTGDNIFYMIIVLFVFVIAIAIIFVIKRKQSKNSKNK